MFASLTSFCVWRSLDFQLVVSSSEVPWTILRRLHPKTIGNLFCSGASLFLGNFIGTGTGTGTGLIFGGDAVVALDDGLEHSTHLAEQSFGFHHCCSEVNPSLAATSTMFFVAQPVLSNQHRRLATADQTKGGITRNGYSFTKWIK
jgi:hypothetical protein